MTQVVIGDSREVRQTTPTPPPSDATVHAPTNSRAPEALVSSTALPTPPATALSAPAAETDRRWPAAIWALLAGTLVVRGLGFAYPFLSYHLDGIGFTTQAIGQVLAVFGIGWALGQLACGWAADRIGRRRTLLAAMVIAAATLPLLAQATSFWTVCAAALIAGIVYDAPRPIVSACIADLIPDESRRTEANGWRHGAVNVGAAFTGAAGGILAGETGIPALFLLNAAACAVFGLIALRCMEDDAAPEQNARTEGSRWRVVVRDRRLWLLWLASLLSLTCAATMFTGLPMLMADDGLGPAAYGWTHGANAAVVLAITPVLTPWLSRRSGAEHPMIGMLAVSSLLLGTGMGIAGLADTTWGYSLAVSIAVPGEVVFFVAASDVLTRIAPEHSRGMYAGIWGATLAGAVILAPVLATWSLTTGGDALAALTALTAGLLGAVLCLPLLPLINRRSTTADSTRTP
ncbi:MFS transporter [Streptomyces sp. NPDC051907]|uniref:MFS transporter n=1 Tax=Streptomyces sp. NPDC051907 TaxID=3155284 RepID=UPI0034229D06